MTLRLACAGLVLLGALLETGCCCRRFCCRPRRACCCAPTECCSSPGGPDFGAAAIYPSYRQMETTSVPKSFR